MIPRFELRHLRYFVAVAEALHFSAAADRLRIAQPSLSQQIKALETALGVPLLQRGNRQVRLTPAGAVFLEEARQILANVEQSVVDVRKAQKGLIGRIAIGFLSLTALDVLPVLLNRIRTIMPEVAVTLQEASTEEQMRLIEAGALDIGIVREPALPETIASADVYRDKQIVALPEGHRLAGRKFVELSQLRDDNFILFPRLEGTAMHDRIIGACAQAGFSPRVVQECRTITTMIGLVAIGLGVAVVPSVSQRIGQPGMFYRALRPDIGLDTKIIWHAGRLAENAALDRLVRSQSLQGWPMAPRSSPRAGRRG